MKFQHTTSLAIQPGIVRLTATANSGSPMTIIPGGPDTNFTVSLQQVVFSWTNLTGAGQINLMASVADPNPFIVYQSAPSTDIVPVPFFDEVYNLGTYGLRAINNAVGGVYSVTAFYTVLLP